MGEWLSVITANGLFKVYSTILTKREKNASGKYFQAENPKSFFSFLSMLSEGLG
jgi:hypothetical protein